MGRLEQKFFSWWRQAAVDQNSVSSVSKQPICTRSAATQKVLLLIHQLCVQSHTHTHSFNGRFRDYPGEPVPEKLKPIWILLKQETVSGSSISWTICKSAPRSRQITTPAPHHSVFYRPDALPAAQPTASKHWRQWVQSINQNVYCVFPHSIVISVKFSDATELNWVRFYVLLDTKQVISETFFPANLLARYWKN